MQKHCIAFPMDWESRTWFRRLVRAVQELQAPDRALALEAALTTFRDCAYALAHEPRLGHLNADQAQLLSDDLTARLPGFTLDTLVACGLLAVQEAGYFCAPFAEENKHLVGDPMQRMGGVTAGVKHKAKALEVDAQKQAFLLDPAVFRRPTDGAEFSPDETGKVIMVIKLLDNYCGRNARLTSEYPAGLIADAWRALNQYSEETIHQVAAWLRLNAERAHPGIPKTTEQVLADFGRYAALAK